MNNKFINIKLYNDVKEDIIKKIPKHSAYRSMLIVKEYKNRGGKIKGNNESDLKRWLAEKWVNVYAYLKENKEVPCGDNNYIKRSACRPLIRVNEKTPLTIKELMKKHNKNKILEAVNIKNKDPQNKILLWKNLNVINKK
jgi:hypothetical protein